MKMDIYGVLYTVLFVILCIMFIGTFAKKRELPGKWCRYAIVGGMIMADYFISVKLDGDIILKEVAIIGAGTLFMCLYFRQRCIKTAIFVISYQGICFITDYISILMLSKCFPAITVERLSEPLLINALLGILSQMLQVCFIMVLRRYVVKKSSEMLTTLEWVRFTIVPVYTIIVLIALLTNFEIPESSHQKNILICIAFGLLVMNIIIFCLINDILKREVQITENRLLLERVKNETGMYRTISENYDKQKKREHEYKNQLALIAALASENRADEINHYLKQYNHEIMQHTDFIDTNNVIVNAILNSRFLCNRQETNFYLLLLPGDKKFKTKEVSSQLGVARLSFGNETYMEKFLDITPGSVSILGLMNDKENHVQLLIDEDLLKEPYIGCHPCINTSSLKINMKDMMEKIIPAMKHEPIFVKLGQEE